MSNLGNKKIMAENIRYFMDKYGKTRNEMCEALGVKYTTFTDWVKGNTYPRIDKIELMANYFGITKADLVEKRSNTMRNDEQQKIFTLNLNNFIRNTGKTQREIADVIGVSPQTFNTWCQGIALPRMGKIQALADYFGINKSDLIEDRSGSPQSSLSSQPAAKSPALRPDESALLALYNQLNSDGQEKVCDLLDDIVSSGKYEFMKG